MSTSAIATSEEGLLERARAVLALLRENAPRCARESHFGGDEPSVATQFEVLAEIATACPSTSLEPYGRIACGPPPTNMPFV